MKTPLIAGNSYRDNQQPSPENGKVQRLGESRTSKWMEMGGNQISYLVEDIV